jgi:hypothetical protein
VDALTPCQYSADRGRNTSSDVGVDTLTKIEPQVDRAHQVVAAYRPPVPPENKDNSSTPLMQEWKSLTIDLLVNCHVPCR